MEHNLGSQAVLQVILWFAIAREHLTINITVE